MRPFRSLNVLLILSALLLASCASSRPRAGGGESNARADIHAADYGYSPENPIRVGGASPRQGPPAERAYLSSLRGPNGEPVTYEREGSCCPFETENGFGGLGLLDGYKVEYDGIEKPVTLYLNMYDGGELGAPVGFTRVK